MTLATTVRLLTVALAFPNTALLLVLAYHFRALGKAQPDGTEPLVDACVFRWATMLYIGVAIIDVTMSIRQVAVLTDPMNAALPFLFVGQLVSTVALLGLLRSLAARTW